MKLSKRNSLQKLQIQLKKRMQSGTHLKQFHFNLSAFKLRSPKFKMECNKVGNIHGGAHSEWSASGYDVWRMNRQNLL